MIFAVVASVLGGLIMGFGIGFIWRDSWLATDDSESEPTEFQKTMRDNVLGSKNLLYEKLEQNVILMSDEEVAKLEAKLKRKSYHESENN